MVLPLFLRNVVLVIISCVLFLIPSLALHAQEGSGIGISPAVIEEGLEPNQSKAYEISISNLSSTDQTYYLFTRDITDATDGGTPIYANKNQEKTGFELSQWVTLSTGEISIPANESKTIEITIDVPDNATPGSHFGAMFVSLDPPKLRTNGASVGYKVANIISIRVAGDAISNAQIRQFSTGDYIYGESKVDFQARIENKGTVLVRPIGPLEVENMFGKRVALMTFNESRAGIYPGRERVFDVVWEDEGPGFGRYQAILSLVYGENGSQATISSTVSFWILPLNIILPALGVLAFLLLSVYIVVKVYIRNKLQIMAGGSRRVISKRRNNGGMSALLLSTVVMLAVTALFLIILVAVFA